VCRSDNQEQSNLNALTEQDMTGLVVDSGDGGTHVHPVCDSYVIASCVKHMPLAGKDITGFIVDSIRARDRANQISYQDHNDIATKIKEKYGYVCKDVLAEFSKFDKKKKDDNGAWIQSSKFKRLVHKCVNGSMVPVDVGYEQFLAPEMFFHPVSCPLLSRPSACRNL